MLPANHIRKTFLLSVLFLWGLSLSAQVTKVRGVVTDAATGAALPFVNVFFEGTTIGISTDLEGRYYLETTSKEAKILQASMIGYTSFSVEVPYGQFSQVDIALEPDSEHLAASVIKPDNRRLKRLLRKIDQSRRRNDPYNYANWGVKAYTKTEFDATNADWITRLPILKPTLEPITACKDTSVETGVSFYPVLLSETISQLYHTSDPDMDKEIIEANHISGVEADNFLTQYSGNYLLNANLYKENVNLFNLQVPSPLAAYGHPFYDYYLIDSLYLDGRKTYTLRFHPKPVVTSPTFDGQVDIDAEDYSIRSARIRLADRANVNWIRHIDYDMNYTRLESGQWFPTSQSMFIDFSIAVSDSSKVVSFLGNRKQYFGEPDFSAKIPDRYLETDDPVINEAKDEEEEIDWSEARMVPLTPREQQIYDAIDDIQSSRDYGLLYGIGRSLVLGYIEGRNTPIGIGPWAKTITYNPTEGIHIGTGFRTTRYFSHKLRLSGSIGYGFKDKLLKGGGSAEYTIRRDKTRKVSASFLKDYVQLGQGTGAFSDNNFFNSMIKHRNDRQSLIMVSSLEYEHEVSGVLSTFTKAEHRRFYGNEMVPFALRSGGSLASFDAAQIGFNARFAFEERIHRGFFEKTHIFTKYPVLSFEVTGGYSAYGTTIAPFVRSEASFTWTTPGLPIGFSVIHINAGKIIGNVPYPLLKLHEGNQGIFMDNTSFSCMNYFEYASDQWLDFFIEHNFDGIILGKIPVIELFDLREIVAIKGAFGSISSQNLEGSRIIPIEGMHDLHGKPYFEMSVGVSNILRLLRFDYVWKLTCRNQEGPNSRFMIGLDFKF